VFFIGVLHIEFALFFSASLLKIPQEIWIGFLCIYFFLSSLMFNFYCVFSRCFAFYFILCLPLFFV